MLLQPSLPERQPEAQCRKTPGSLPHRCCPSPPPYGHGIPLPPESHPPQGAEKTEYSQRHRAGGPLTGFSSDCGQSCRAGEPNTSKSMRRHNRGPVPEAEKTTAAVSCAADRCGARRRQPIPQPYIPMPPEMPAGRYSLPVSAAWLRPVSVPSKLPSG